MTQRLAARSLALVGLAILVGCGAREPTAQPPPPSTPQPVASAVALPSATAAAPATAAPMARQQPNSLIGGPRHLVAGLAGTLLLRRPGWPAPAQVGFGTLLAAGDVITITGGSATIVCADLTTEPVRPGVDLMIETDMCAHGGPALISLPDGLVTAMRGRNTQLPFVISPRATALRDPLPTIRWNDTGHPPYNVRVSSDGQEWRVEGIRDTHVVYDGTPPLTVGTTYLVTITDSANQSSEQELARGLGFWLLEPDAIAEVAAEVKRIDSAALPAEGAAYVRAWLLAGSGLRADAAAELESLVAAGNAGAAASLALGDLYRRQGLIVLAEPSYAQAAALAKAASDEPMLAAAEAGRGEMLYQLNDNATAVDILSSARDRFARLGDAARAADIADLIAQIQ